MASNLIIDAGANHGLFSLEVAARNLGFQVLAIEADPDLAADLQKKSNDRGLSNHSVICIALDEKEGQAPFHISDLGDKGTSSLSRFDMEHIETDEYWATRDDLRHSRTIIVERKRLDTLLSTIEFDEISFIKIDVQGYDLAALASLGEMLGRVKAGMLEVVSSEHHSLYEDDQATMARALNFLERRGFVVHAIKPNDPSSNEYNIFFTRGGISLEEVETELSLRGIPLYDGKHFWHLPRSSLHAETLLQALPAYRAIGEGLMICKANLDRLDGSLEGTLNCPETSVKALNAMSLAIDQARLAYESLTPVYLVMPETLAG